MLPVSLDYPLLIAPLVFSNVYLSYSYSCILCFIKSHSGLCMVVFSGHLYSNFLDRVWEIIYQEFEVLCKDIKKCIIYFESILTVRMKF